MVGLVGGPHAPTLGGIAIRALWSSEQLKAGQVLINSAGVHHTQTESVQKQARNCQGKYCCSGMCRHHCGLAVVFFFGPILVCWSAEMGSCQVLQLICRHRVAKQFLASIFSYCVQAWLGRKKYAPQANLYHAAPKMPLSPTSILLVRVAKGCHKCLYFVLFLPTVVHTWHLKKWDEIGRASG